MTVEQLAEYAQKRFGNKLWILVISDEKVELYSNPLSDRPRTLEFTIEGVPKKDNCCY
jgi:hypothetical protein